MFGKEPTEQEARDFQQKMARARFEELQASGGRKDPWYYEQDNKEQRILESILHRKLAGKSPRDPRIPDDEDFDPNANEEEEDDNDLSELDGFDSGSYSSKTDKKTDTKTGENIGISPKLDKEDWTELIKSQLNMYKSNIPKKKQ